MLGYGIHYSLCTGSNQIMLGNTAITQIRAQVSGITTYSDKRFKTNIKENVKGLEFLRELTPVTYSQDPLKLHSIWGTPDSITNEVDFSDIKKVQNIGFLAQEVESAAKKTGFDFPGVDVPRNEKEVYTLRYTDFIPVLVKAVQELDEKNKELLRMIEELKKENQEIKETIKK